MHWTYDELLDLPAEVYAVLVEEITREIAAGSQSAPITTRGTCTVALTGKFIADFESFYDAVQKADVEIKTFGTNAEKVGGQLNRMVDQFSGRKVVQDATVMARAIEEVGGVSKLTEKELQKAGAAMEQAIAKLRALGEGDKVSADMLKIADAAKQIGVNAQKTGDTVPGDMKKVSKSTEDVNKSQLDLMGTLKNVAMTFGIAFSAQQLVGFVKGVFEAAGAVNDLAAGMGVSAEAAQKFAFAAKQSGGSAEDVGKAIGNMNRELADGSKEYVAAVKSVGLSWDELRKQSPEDAFRTVIAAVEDISDPMLQAETATRLFGKAGAALLPAIRDGFLDVADSADVMSNETVARLDAAGDAWAEFGNKITIVTGEIIGDLMKNWSVVFASWGNFWTNLKIVTLEGKEAQTKWIDAQIAAAAATNNTDKAVVNITKDYGPFQSQLKSARQVLDEQTAADKRSKEAIAEREKELAKIKKAQDDYNNSLTDLIDALSGADLVDKAELWMQALAKTVPVAQMTRQAQDQINKVMAEAIEVYAALGEIAPRAMTDLWLATLKPIPEVKNLQTALGNLGRADVELFASRTVSALGTLPAAMKGVEQAGASMFANLKKAFDDLPATILKAVQGGGDIGKTIGAALGGAAGADIGKEAGEAVGKKFGEGLGKMIGGAIPIIGTMLGALGGAAIDKLFKSEEKAVNKTREAAVQAAGGLAELNRLAAAAGVTLDALLDAKKPESYKLALDQLNAAINYQQQSMAVLDETTKRYGFTLEELGPALSRAELDKQAQQLFKDFEVLNAAGIDSVAITTRMADAVNAYVGDALAMGVEVPAAMKPMLEQMASMGTLTDANGNAITDLEDAGISFAMTMSEGFKSLIDEVKKLTDAIGRGLGVAVDSTSKKIKDVPQELKVKVIYDDPGYKTTQHVSVEGGDLEGYQHGTDGFRNFGAGTPVMLHGWEAVVPRDTSTQGPPLMAGAGGGGTPTIVQITINAEGAFFDTPGSLQRLADKVNEALTAKYGLTHRMRAA